MLAGVHSCKKYKDAPATTDPRLTNPYCNDPAAVNYNWGFPGKPDNSVCFYPTDLFQGVYELHDSVFLTSNGYYVFADTLVLTINKHDNIHIGVIGFCSSGDSITMSAGSNYLAVVDTVITDSLAKYGQQLCGIADTVYGTITKDRINDSILYINLFVASDTGVITNHLGTAKLKYKK